MYLLPLSAPPPVFHFISTWIFFFTLHFGVLLFRSSLTSRSYRYVCIFCITPHCDVLSPRLSLAALFYFLRPDVQDTPPDSHFSFRTSLLAMQSNDQSVFFCPLIPTCSLFPGLCTPLCSTYAFPARCTFCIPRESEFAVSCRQLFIGISIIYASKFTPSGRIAKFA